MIHLTSSFGHLFYWWTTRVYWDEQRSLDLEESTWLRFVNRTDGRHEVFPCRKIVTLVRTKQSCRWNFKIARGIVLRSRLALGDARLINKSWLWIVNPFDKLDAKWHLNNGLEVGVPETWILWVASGFRQDYIICFFIYNLLKPWTTHSVTFDRQKSIGIWIKPRGTTDKHLLYLPSVKRPSWVELDWIRYALAIYFSSCLQSFAPWILPANKSSGKTMIGIRMFPIWQAHWQFQFY